jgi:hypothetical protein
MNRSECTDERLSKKTIGLLVSIVSLLLMTVGLVIVPVVGFVFALPILLLGLGLIYAPGSKACRITR